MRRKNFFICAPKIFETNFNRGFCALSRRLVITRGNFFVGEILLADEMIFKVVRIFVTDAVPESLRALVMSVAQMFWDFTARVSIQLKDY